MLNAKQITNLYVLGYVMAELQSTSHQDYPHWDQSFKALDTVLTDHGLPLYGNEFIEEESGIVLYNDDTKAYSREYLERTDESQLVPYPYMSKMLRKTLDVGLPITVQEIRIFLNELVNDVSNNDE